MKRAISATVALSLGLLGVVLAGAPSAGASAPSPSSAAAARPSEPVIIVLKKQYSFPGTISGTLQRTKAADAAQAPVLASLRRSHATHVTQLHLIDAVVATVSPAEAAELASRPSVAAVAPDAVFRGPAPVSGAPASAAAGARLARGVCPAKGAVQLDPEGVELVHAVSGNRRVPTARRLGFTGAGVTVGDIAAGIDPGEPELVRPDGQRVIAVYKDFSGEGTAVQSPVDQESYLDDSVMAAQGRRVYDLRRYDTGLPKGCDIRLQGVAPGITIDAYKVYAESEMTTTSAFLEAIDYAVDVSHVNVLNEEGGSFPMPDTSQDLIKAANDAAMRAGVTITSPSYDAGPENTIWSPSSQPGVISVGASTAFRSYAQAGMGDYDAMRARGWVSDNISSLSSGGATEGGRAIDVVAPGDLDWIACDSHAVACFGTNLTTSGGTSESGPIVAAVAALVIQAYRSTHRSANPSPTLVRDIISSSADDLGMPGSLQGAGLVDAYRAVRAAMAANHGAVARAGRGPALVAGSQQLTAIGKPGAPARMSFELTNDGTRHADVTIAGRALGRPRVIVTKRLRFKAATIRRIFRFTLSGRASLLTADIANPGGQNGSNTAAISLVNPQGKFTAYSLPQGGGNHGQVEVRNPEAGRWEADVTYPGGGPVYAQITTARMRSWGIASPSHIGLAPGASARIRLSGHLGGSPGDQSASVTVQAAGWGHSSLPVTLRSLVPIAHGAGRFHATLIGGNGRGSVPAQTFFYEFDVPAGQPALDVQTRLAGSNDDPYYTYLVDPAGQAVAQASNQLLVRESRGGPVNVGEPGARLHVLSPRPGRWTVIITSTNPVNGNALRTPLTGTISFAPVAARVHGLPDSPRTQLTQGARYVVGVTVRNDGDAAESYYLDGRLDRTTSLRLSPTTPASELRLPLSVIAKIPQWIVPTDSTSLTATAVSTAPTTFDFSPLNGEPDIGATVSGNDATAVITAPAGTQLTQGDWDVLPQQVGPFGRRRAAHSRTTLSLVATTLAFDPGLTSDTGDLWEQGAAARAAFKPVVVKPGKATTLYAAISPVAAPGDVVHGTLYLDDSSALTNNGPSPSGDQLEAIPYEYTVGS